MKGLSTALRTSALTVAALCAAIGLQAQSPLTLFLEPVAGNGPMSVNSNFSEYNGRTTIVERLNYYLCDFYLVHDGGNVTALPGNYLLVDGADFDYSLGTTSITNIEKIRFAVGVDATVNHNDPNSWTNGHPLSMQTPSMHWGWSAGYKFAAFEGKGDADNNNHPETMWQLHPTGDQLLRNVEVTVGATVTGNGTEIHLNYDMQAWLRDIDLPTVGAEHGSTGAAITVMDNINTYGVFRAQGTVGIPEANPEAVSLYFNYTDMERPIAHYRVLNGQGNYGMRVTDMQGQVLFTAANIAAEGKTRIDTKLAQGVYICSLLQDGQPIINKKFQISR